MDTLLLLHIEKIISISVTEGYHCHLGVLAGGLKVEFPMFFSIPKADTVKWLKFSMERSTINVKRKKKSIMILYWDFLTGLEVLLMDISFSLIYFTDTAEGLPFIRIFILK